MLGLQRAIRACSLPYKFFPMSFSRYGFLSDSPNVSTFGTK
jgi:hypothetical protein